MVVVGYRELDPDPPQVLGFDAISVEVLQIPGQHDGFGAICRQSAAASTAAFHRRQEADLAPAKLGACRIDEDDIVVEQQRPVDAVFGRIVAQPHPHRVQVLVLDRHQGAAEGAAGAEGLFGVAEVGVHIGRPHGDPRGDRPLGMPAEEVDEIRTVRGQGGGLDLVTVGHGGAGQNQRPLQVVVGAIETETVEPRLDEGEGGEDRLELVAQHQPHLQAASAFISDHQAPEQAVVLVTFPDRAALRVLLLLLPLIEQPATLHGVSQLVIPHQALELRRHVVAVGVDGIVGLVAVPGRIEGHRKVPGHIPFVHLGPYGIQLKPGGDGTTGQLRPPTAQSRLAGLPPCRGRHAQAGHERPDPCPPDDESEHQ